MLRLRFLIGSSEIRPQHLPLLRIAYMTIHKPPNFSTTAEENSPTKLSMTMFSSMLPCMIMCIFLDWMMMGLTVPFPIVSLKIRFSQTKLTIPCGADHL